MSYYLIEETRVASNSKYTESICENKYIYTDKQRAKEKMEDLLYKYGYSECREEYRRDIDIYSNNTILLDAYTTGTVTLKLMKVNMN